MYNVEIDDTVDNIRNLSLKDYDMGVVELLGQLTEISKEKISRSDFGKYVGKLEENPNHITIVVDNGKRDIAIATLFIEPKLIHNLSFVGHIEDVVVDKDYRGLGLGKKIIQHLVHIAQTHGCYKVILDCDEKNTCFYEKCNFELKGAEMSFYFEK